MSEDRIPIVWDGFLVGYLSEPEDDSTFYGELQRLRICGRWRPVAGSHLERFLAAIRREGRVSVLAAGLDYWMFHPPSELAEIQSLRKITGPPYPSPNDSDSGRTVRSAES